MIFDKNLSISTFELEKDLINNKIIYEDENKEEEEEESIYKYNSNELSITKYEFFMNENDSNNK